jgi:hypothetical protein
MRFTLLVLFNFLPFFNPLAQAQDSTPCQALTLTEQENQQWLIALGKADTPQQWNLIADRYFMLEDCGRQEIQYKELMPMLVINSTLYGPVTNYPNRSRRIRDLINPSVISDLQILYKKPEGWVLHKPFRGAILITIDDERISKGLEEVNKLKPGLY